MDKENAKIKDYELKIVGYTGVFNAHCKNTVFKYSKGNFNTACHNNRDGIKPENLKTILNQWSNILKTYNVHFYCEDYTLRNSNIGDLMYLDPPFANTTGMYFGTINYEILWEYLQNQKGNYLLSFDGISGKDNRTYDVPTDIYNEHKYIYNGISSFKKLSKKKEYVKESLYIKIQ